jgi:predicted outer membrane repeat protein
VTRAIQMWRRVLGVPAAAVLAIGGLSAAVLVASVTPASAAGPCIVTLTTAGAGPSEFRGAINSANVGNCLVGSNEVVNIAAGLAITLNVQQALYNNATDPLVINGNGATIDALGHNRILVVTSPQLVTVNNLTLNNGNPGANRGGAIRTDVGGITLNGDTFTNNQATNGGGAVSVESGNVTVTGSTFTGNKATGTGGTQQGGGAIRAHHTGAGSNTFTITNSTFANNSEAGDDGGGVWASDNYAVSITGSTFSGNRAGTDDGGAVDITGSPSLTISNSTFLSNSAVDDGGAIDCETTGGVVTVTGSTFAGNSTDAGAGDSAGAIDLENPCSLKIVNSTITRNTSGDDAAITAERTNSPVTIVYSTIVNNATNPATPGAASAPKPEGSDTSGQVNAQNDNVPVATANLETNDPAHLTVFGTVFGRPHGGPNCSDATGAPLTGIASAGYNLADDTSCGLNAATDRQAAGLDPGVGALANNGGPTQTLLPLTGSPLIDAIAAAACQAGPAAGVTTDQRGITRPQGVGCDIGAVEVVPALVVQPRFTG